MQKTFTYREVYNLVASLLKALEIVRNSKQVADKKDNNGLEHDEKGRFTSKEGGNNATVTINKNEKQVVISKKIKDTYNSITDIEKNSVIDSFGENYYNLKGKPEKAIAMLLYKRKGYVNGAFYRKEIGDIDLVWGNKTQGIKHTEKRRLETNQDFMKLMENLPDIINKGMIVNSSKVQNCKIFLYDDMQAVVPLAYKITKDNEVKRNWILTIFEEYD